MKKRLFSVVVLLIMVLTMSLPCFAYESFTFRSIPWLTNKSQVISTLQAEGYKAYYTSNETSIPDWFQTWSNITGDYKVETGGCYSAFQNIPVAGYTADLDLYFIYPIVNNLVQRDNDLSQLYLAKYEFSDMEDMTAVYEDLKTKLTGLYGTPEIKNSDSNWTDTIGVLWTADDGSLIWLACYTAYGSTTVKIWYAAPNCTDMLKTLETQITQETLAAEAKSREENQSNTSGL